MNARILCAIDIADVEQNKLLLKRSRQLAELDHAELDVVTVVPGFGMSLVGSYFPEDAEEKVEVEAKKTLRETISEALGAEYAGDVRAIVAKGKVYEAILRTARKVGSTVIVMGSNSPDLKDFLLGPNAGRVARHAHCSMYIMRSHVKKRA